MIEHVLKLNLDIKPVRQQLCTMFEERKQAAKAEVQKLLDAGVIHEVQFSEWLANIVMVPKKNDKWRMCINFTNMNKACPKDDYPLVDVAVGSELTSMLDCFSGYHQNRMKRSDEEKTNFTTPFGTY